MAFEAGADCVEDLELARLGERLRVLYSLAFRSETVPSLCHLEKLALMSLVLHIARKRTALLGMFSVLCAL